MSIEEQVEEYMKLISWMCGAIGLIFLGVNIKSLALQIDGWIIFNILFLLLVWKVTKNITLAYRLRQKRSSIQQEAKLPFPKKK